MLERWKVLTVRHSSTKSGQLKTCKFGTNKCLVAHWETSTMNPLPSKSDTCRLYPVQRQTKNCNFICQWGPIQG